MSSRCHYCHGELSAEALRRNRLCPHCTSELHSCKNCTHFCDTLATKCRETQSPWVSDRSAENQCDYFEFKPDDQSLSNLTDSTAEAEEAKKAFRALFRST